MSWVSDVLSWGCQAAAFVEQQRLGLASQAEFRLDTSALSKRKATTAAITAWPDDDHSDDDFDVGAATQVPRLPLVLSNPKFSWHLQ